MKKLNKEELIKVEGGAFKLTATLLNSITKTFNTIVDFGRTIGTSIRRIISKTTCSL